MLPGVGISGRGLPGPLQAFHKLKNKLYFVKLLRIGFFSDVAASIGYPEIITNREQRTGHTGVL